MDHAADTVSHLVKVLSGPDGTGQGQTFYPAREVSSAASTRQGSEIVDLDAMD